MYSKTKRTIKHTVAGVVFLGMMTVVQAAPFRLQVLVTSSADNAAKTVARLNAAGYATAVSRPTDDGSLYRVLTGEYATRAEANFAKPALRGIGFNDVFAVDEAPATEKAQGVQPAVFGDSLPSVATTSEFKRLPLDFKVGKGRAKSDRITKELEKTSDSAASEKQLLKKVNGWWRSSQAEKAIASCDVYTQRFPQSPKAAHVKLKRAYWLLEADRDEEAKAQFTAVGVEHPDAVETGEAALRLAYLMLLEKGRDAEALGTFRAVASGTFPATSEVRMEAMLRSAALFHRGKDLDMAMQAYEAIARIADNDEIKALAEMQCAGLDMELAWNGKSTFKSARARCEQLLEKYPNAHSSTRATAALMGLETHAYEKDYDKLLEKSDAFLAEFSDMPEARLGYYWIIKAQLETGDPDGAATAAEAMLSEDLETKERFKNIDVKGAIGRIKTEAAKKKAASR